MDPGNPNLQLNSHQFVLMDRARRTDGFHIYYLGGGHKQDKYEMHFPLTVVFEVELVLAVDHPKADSKFILKVANEGGDKYISYTWPAKEKDQNKPNIEAKYDSGQTTIQVPPSENRIREGIRIWKVVFQPDSNVMFYSDDQPMFKRAAKKPDAIKKMTLESDCTIYEFHVTSPVGPFRVFDVKSLEVPLTPTLTEGARVKFRGKEFTTDRDCFFTLSRKFKDTTGQLKCVIPKPPAGEDETEIFTLVTVHGDHVSVKSDTGLSKVLKHDIATANLFGIFNMGLLDVSFSTGL